MPRSLLPQDLFRHLENGRPLRLLDVREPWEHAWAALPQSQLIPLGDLPRRWSEIAGAAGQPWLVYCHHGVRSWQAALFLEAQGFKEVYSLTGGIDAWSLTVDPLVRRY